MSIGLFLITCFTPAASAMLPAAVPAAVILPTQETPSRDAPTTAPVEAPSRVDAEDRTPGKILPPPAFDDPNRPAAFADLSDDALFEAAANALDAVTTLRARFVQVAPSGNVAEGDLSLRRPGRVRFDYDDPNPQLIVATSGTVFVHDAARETTDSYPLRATPLRYLLNERLDREAAVLRSVQRDSESVTLILGAQNEEEVRGDLALTFTAPDLQLTEWAVIEPDGATTVVALSDVETGVRLPGRLFARPDDGGSFLRDR